MHKATATDDINIGNFLECKYQSKAVDLKLKLTFSVTGLWTVLSSDLVVLLLSCCQIND